MYIYIMVYTLTVGMFVPVNVCQHNSSVISASLGSRLLLVSPYGELEEWNGGCKLLKLK